MFDLELYHALDRFAAPILAWVAFWAAWTVAKTALRVLGLPVRFTRHMILTELPGLPLMLLNSVGFVLALRAHDWLSAALFAWWGPGYLVVVALVLTRGKRLDWSPWGEATSWGCKLSYLALMAVRGHQGLWTLPFAYSVWIMGDQVRLAWFDGNADRTRRTTEDGWLPRVLYPALLTLPCLTAIPGGWLSAALGLAILALWAGGIRRTLQTGSFWRRPDPRTSDNLRDIVYLARPAARSAAPLAR